MKRSVSRAPLVGNAAYDILHGIKIGLKDVLAPGPVLRPGPEVRRPDRWSRHCRGGACARQAKRFRGPVLVHCITRKGNGFKAAEDHEEDHFHAVGKINAITGEAIGATPGRPGRSCSPRNSSGWAATTNESWPLRQRWCIRRACTGLPGRFLIAASMSASPNSTL